MHDALITTGYFAGSKVQIACERLCQQIEDRDEWLAWSDFYQLDLNGEEFHLVNLLIYTDIVHSKGINLRLLINSLNHHMTKIALVFDELGVPGVMLAEIDRFPLTIGGVLAHQASASILNVHDERETDTIVNIVLIDALKGNQVLAAFPHRIRFDLASDQKKEVRKSLLHYSRESVVKTFDQCVNNMVSIASLTKSQ